MIAIVVVADMTEVVAATFVGTDVAIAVIIAAVTEVAIAVIIAAVTDIAIVVFVIVDNVTVVIADT